MDKNLYRVIDANINRLREGIRVIEDLARYLNNDKELSNKLKSLRHKSKIEDNQALLKSRDAQNDVLRTSHKSEMNRSSLMDIIIANYKRAQEASRVLEEIYKLKDQKISENFKHIRYELYTLEQRSLISGK